jgi:DNA polymerase III subunit epsilon
MPPTLRWEPAVPPSQDLRVVAILEAYERKKGTARKLSAGRFKSAFYMNSSWIAIDFETASVRGTPCAVGIAEVNDGVVENEVEWLIRPPLFEFSPFNVALHGITPEMCERAPTWPESLAEIERIRAGRPLLAHNAAFDVGVIRDACALSKTAWPTLSYACSLVIGRRVWPGLSSYSLPYLAAHLELDEGMHHRAESDAAVAAEIGCLALAKSGFSNLPELVASVDALMGSVTAGEWSGCHLRDLGISIPVEPSPGAVPDEDHPLFGKTIAFTGALAIPRRG